MKLVSRVAAILLICTLPACYEGWERYRGKGNGTGNEPKTPPAPPEIKKIHHILFQPIVLSAAAIADDTCFPTSATREYRANEWTERVTSLASGLAGIAESVKTIPIEIGKDDCEKLEAVRLAAIDPTPTGYEVPEADALDRPMVHLKASFWDEEPLITAPSTVKAKHWALFKELEAKGRRVSSFSYFVIERSDNGYFSEWRDALLDDEQKSGTPIEAIDPTEPGIAARRQLIATDTGALIAWILENSQ